MEKKMNHEKLLELLEKKSFEQLSADEQAFVLEHTTSQEYELQRMVMIESNDLNDNVEPLPLILKEKKGIVVYCANISLYLLY